MKKLYLLFIFVNLVTYSQEPISIHLSKKEGLPDNEIYHLVEDNKGFIWLAADKGLFRYDGKIFKNYTNKNKRGHSVFGVKTDQEDRVWCTNISGQFFYTEGNELITFVDLKEILKGELAEFVITEDKLLVFSNNKILAIDLKTRRTKKISKSNLTVGLPYYFNNKLFVTIGEKLFHITKNNLLEEYNPNPVFHSKFFKTLLFSHKNELISASFDANKEVNFFRIYKNEVQELEKPKEIRTKHILDFYCQNNEVWIATDAGVILCEIEKNKIIYKSSFLKNQYITKIIKDSHDNIWITTLRNGVYIIPNKDIKKITLPKGVSNINCIKKINDNELIFGTTDGKVCFYNIEKGLEKIIVLPKAKKVTSIYHQALKNNIIISTEYLAFSLDTKTNYLKKIKTYNNVKSFSEIHKNKFLYTIYNAARLVTEKNNKIERKELETKRAYTSHHNKKSKISYVAYVDELMSYNAQEKSTSLKYKNKDIGIGV